MQDALPMFPSAPRLAVLLLVVSLPAAAQDAPDLGAASPDGVPHVSDVDLGQSGAALITARARLMREDGRLVATLTLPVGQAHLRDNLRAV